MFRVCRVYKRYIGYVEYIGLTGLGLRGLSLGFGGLGFTGLGFRLKRFSFRA